LDPNAPANPCGIIAYTIFNDSFVIKNADSNSVYVTTNGIAWPSDLQKYQISSPGLQWYNVTDPRFMNWMRIATLPNFRKLWGRINSDLPAGNYTLLINNSTRRLTQIMTSALLEPQNILCFRLQTFLVQKTSSYRLFIW
jgi:hypothetical protein